MDGRVVGFVIAVAHVPGWTGSTINSGWLVQAGGLPLLTRSWSLSVYHWLILASLVWATTSLLWSPTPWQGGLKLFGLFVFALAFCYGRSLATLDFVYVGLGLGMGVSALVALAQWIWGIEWFVQSVAPGGLYGNRSILAQTAALVAIPLVIRKIYWPLPGPAICVLLGNSRGAYAALAVAAVCLRRWLALPLAIGMILAIYLNQRGDEMRWEIWSSILATPSLLGHGLGSFAYNTANGFVLHAHNDFLELWSELGVGTAPLLAFFALLPGWDDAARIGLICCGVVALVAFPLFVPTTSFLIGVMAGYLSKGEPHGTLATN